MIDLIKLYIEKEKSRLDFFINKSAALRTSKYASELKNLISEVSIIKLQIKRAILSKKISYKFFIDSLINEGLKDPFSEDLDLRRFISNLKLSDSLGLENATKGVKRNRQLFKELCLEVWEDYIITNEERLKLNRFCKENNIDQIQQGIIENEVIKEKGLKEVDPTNSSDLKKIEIDVADLPRGVYYLHLIFDDKKNKQVDKIRILLN